MTLSASLRISLIVLLGLLCTEKADAQVKKLIDESCIACHDDSTDTALNFEALDFDLKNEKTFAMWERIFDRVTAGEMPPEDEDRPDEAVQEKALSQIHASLSNRSQAIQKENGRSTIRRLTRTEYEYSLHDLLGISTELARLLPEENESGFDTVAENQGISQLHAKSWLIAADAAIDSAINLGLKPDDEPTKFEMLELDSVKQHLDQPEDGHKILGKEDDGIVIFASGSTYLYSLQKAGVEHSGTFRIRAEAETFHSETPIVVAIFAGNYSRGQSRILGYWDAVPDETLEIDFEPILRRGEYIFPQAFELTKPKDNSNIWNVGPDKYEGAGLKLKWVSIEGPLHNTWPPESASSLLPGVKFKEREHHAWRNNRHIQFDIEMPEGNPLVAVGQSLNKLAARAFRRPLKKNEIKEYLSIAKDAMDQGATFHDAARLSMRTILCSPHFLFHSGDPGELDDFSLASRLSYFFWKSIPDSELLKIANGGELTDDDVLRKQVDRLLDHPKSKRFITDFVGQWLELRRIDATAPDSRLYPEFDPLLRSAMIEESEAFFEELIKEDLSASNLVDSDFVMINRRLAEHYGIEGVEGQHIRRVKTKGTVRGGFLTQASVLKTTANGTTTSPVRRGNWVLTSILGTPSPPPPPNIGSIEPDTRGTTTIREELDAHRDSAVCNSCHRNIDPPGFAMESFDVIGGFREKYRSVEHGEHPTKRLHGRNIWEYKLNLPVDPSGETPDGESVPGYCLLQANVGEKETSPGRESRSATGCVFNRSQNSVC